MKSHTTHEYVIRNPLFNIGSKKVEYKCNETGWKISYPVEEVVKKLLCGGCGKVHQLTQGELSAKDKEAIEKITAETKEHAELLDIIEASTLKKASREFPYERDPDRQRWLSPEAFRI